MFTISDSEQSDSLTIYRLGLSERQDSFAHDVLVGLTSVPKILLPKYFYDDLGSRLFEAICCLPEYYVTRAESEIVTESIGEVINEIAIPDQTSVRLIELGSGSAEKTQPVIESLLLRNTDLHYLPIDISLSSLERSSKDLLLAYPRLRITGYAADYSSALGALRHTTALDQRDNLRTIVLFFGSSIGNLDPSESRDLLREVRTVLHPGDVLLLGADLKKSTKTLIPAYNDALGVTAAFNLNLLVRINRELDGNFDLDQFEHRAIYNEEHGRIEMHLFSRKAQTVQLRGINIEVSFERGESIHTENSYKFKVEELRELAGATGFYLKRIWFDSNQLFSFNMFSAT
jgi:L-histidine N-alpha-methyltransferase